ncbi:hypothetical protein LUZ61_008908 [Rhynchospora tenuis]|uniref:Gnk2-homologous domain-containing protein n=1 Tax=Rhynchospora tenuis TaxID=198213 RepID=A0AAD5ZWG9_9POAL|nr:hypothetical protein LUZ61_008908 [Rhynchospora tenuis]
MIISPPNLISLLTMVLLTTLADSAQLVLLRCETTIDRNHIIRNSSDIPNPFIPHYYTPNYRIRNNSDEPNLNLLLSSLTLSTPIAGFAASIVGEPPHKVYGLAQCRSDISAESCTSCLVNASQHLLGSCPYDDGGIAYFDQCAVRYSADNFFFQLSTLEQQFVYCKALGPFNQDHLKKQLSYMIKSISQIAAFNETVRMFATGVNTQVNDGSQVYGMVQCTRDLSEMQCYKCLRQSFYRVSKLFDCRFEGIAGSLNCLLKYSKVKFFDSDLTWVPPPDPDSNEL